METVMIITFIEMLYPVSSTAMESKLLVKDRQHATLRSFFTDNMNNR